jgi:hypothetical protein
MGKNTKFEDSALERYFFLETDEFPLRRVTKKFMLK